MTPRTPSNEATEAAASPEFAGKTALVTGAARGIGKETAALLHTRGAHVVALDTRPELDALAAELPGVVTVTGDVTAEETATRAVGAAVDAFGGLDILVNNAGRTLNKPVTRTTAQDWDSVMAVNARGAFLFAREAFRAMEERGVGGAIVSTGSYASTVGLPEGAAYSASKGALAQLTKVLALEGGPLGIRANLVAAGVVETDFLDTFRPDSRAYLASFADVHPVGRVAQPREIAEVLCFLVSPRSSFVTGAVLAADGGFTAG
ncbi:SDR family oxidoreductase [Streptomyces sp. NPDC005562]|uniref:SDR family NAD(P)-dependent oxidoreductase n=1 Tax=Streptomyces sp. NPDC005562 TaxID=3154890 RepID=UPI00339F0A5B